MIATEGTILRAAAGPQDPLRSGDEADPQVVVVSHDSAVNGASAYCFTHVDRLRVATVAVVLAAMTVCVEFDADDDLELRQLIRALSGKVIGVQTSVSAD